jgi:ribose 5-phosphate isomerase B
MQRIAIGSDHAGFELKTFLANELNGRGYGVIDVGTDSVAPVDYPPFCFAVGQAVARGQADWGIVVGGSGQGEQIAANKVTGVRAALCNDPYFAGLARQDNNANVIALGGRVVAPQFALQILDAWINTSFAGGRHQRRIDQITEFEKQRLTS